MSDPNLTPEFKLISALTYPSQQTARDIVLANGDDAAVISPNAGNAAHNRVAISVDTIVEGTHFLFSLSTPQQVGIKAVEASVSDIIAVGATPRFILISLTFPNTPSSQAINDTARLIYQGIDDACNRMQLAILGGDTLVGGNSWSISVTSLGYLESDRAILTRGGAKPGDLIYLSGPIGRSAAGLYALKNGLSGLELNEIIQHHLAPRCRYDLLAAKLNDFASSAIDISDGLSSELQHICRASKVGCLIEEALIPLDAATVSVARRLGLNPYELAWNGGEDFEILFTCPPHLEHLAPGVRIGKITESVGQLSVLRGGDLEPIVARGFDHFNDR